MIVVAVVVPMRIRLVARRMDDAGVRIDRRRAVPVAVIMMLDGIAARTARMRAEQRDQGGDDGPEQRQEDNCLNHNVLPRCA